MIVVTSPEKYRRKKYDVTCFLAGGISGCPNWQDEVISQLETFGDTENLVIFNPRNKNFDINNPDAEFDQIKWEFRYLQRMDIFSMYFCKDMIQPICLYELGRYMAMMGVWYPKTWRRRIALSVEDGYPRAKDVLFQTQLADYYLQTGYAAIYTYPAYHRHAQKIFDIYQIIEKYGLEEWA